MKASFLPLLAALASITSPVLANPSENVRDPLLFSAGPTPSGFDPMVDARFEIEGSQTRFVLAGPAFHRTLSGSCTEAVASDGSASVNCEYGPQSAASPTRLLVDWAANGSEAKGRIETGRRTITFERTNPASDTPQWTFKVDGRKVATMDGEALDVERVASARLAAEITAASFILRQIA
jgi:hypothetical protein